MTIYRGPGGTGEARTDSDVTEVRIIADEAEGYKNDAATSASAAASSASAAATAETNAETAEANAETAEANAEAAQAAAEAAQAAAEAAQTAAEAAQTAAELAETNAETAEANAETAEANAETAQAAAEAALASAQAVYDDFDDRYLGAKTSNPTVDNDGNALLTGAMYFNTAAPEMRVYNGTTWQNFSAASAVSSFNSRTGAVTLTDTDVNTALGYTAANDSAVVKLTGSQTIAGTKTFSNNAIISVTDNTNAALRVTQLGTGNALVVEDETNPDSTPFVITSAGNVGINTNAPAAPLQIGNGSSASLGSTAPFAWVSARANSGSNVNTTPQELLRLSWQEGAQDLGAGEGCAINFAASLSSDSGTFYNIAQIASYKENNSDSSRLSSLTFSTSADGLAAPTERMSINSAGVVTMSTGALEVGSSSASTAIFDLQTSATGQAYIRFQDTDTNVATIEYDHTTDLMSFRTNDVDSVFIDSSGNVGIGTSSPIAELHVSKDQNAATTVRITNATAGTDASASVQVVSDTTGGLIASANSTVSTASAITGGASGAGVYTTSAITGGLSVGTTAGPLKFFAGSTSSERARIDSSGNFTIGGQSATRLEVNLTENDKVELNAVDSTNTARNLVFSTGDTERARIDSSGTVTLASTSGLSIGRTAVTSPASTDGNVFSGTYTPTQVSTNTNVDSVTFTSCQYLRVGNTVTVSGQIAIDATTATTDTIVKMSIPIASNFSVARHLGGVGSSLTTPYAANNIACIGDTTNDCVEIRLRPSVNTSLTYIFSFTYQVI